MTRWTREQAAAIQLRGADILVSAAAGSGKTAVLVERIIQIVTVERVPILNLLVVTYTNAAAGEMRERIEAAISSAIETAVDESLKGFLIEQLKVLNRASIKTFHAFCMEVIRGHFQSIGVDPSFRMLNETERSILIEEAIDETFESFYEKASDAFLYLVEGYSGNREDLKLREMIKAVYRFVLSQPYPMKWLQAQMEAYETEDHPMRTLWEQTLLAQMTAKIEGAYEVLEEAMEICSMPGGPLPYLETLKSDYEKFNVLEEAVESGSLSRVEEAIKGFSFDRIKTIKKADRETLDEELVESVKTELRDKLIKKGVFESIAAPFKEKNYLRYMAEIDSQKDAVREIIELTGAFEAAFKEKKQAKNVLDFNDLEHFAIQILEDGAIANTYRNQFKYIFVDEYQDASSIQETIIGQIKSENNLFMVGDVKQSIYKFRLAEPAIFLSKYKSFSKYDDVLQAEQVEDALALNNCLNGARQIRIDLKKNFRTRSDILETVNRFFENVMTERLGEVAYDDAAHLVSGTVFEEAVGAAVEVNVITKKPYVTESTEEAEEGDVDVSSYGEDNVALTLEMLKTDEVEARSIAAKIKEVVGSPVYSPKTGEWRPCRYKDIVILIRSFRAWQQTFDSVFSEEGIPFYAESNSGYFDTLEIRWMMDFLKVIDNPYQDLELLAIMRSPMFGFSIEELIEIKNRGIEKRYFYEKLKGVAAEESSEIHSGIIERESLEVRLKAFVDLLESLRAQSTYTAIDELILEIFRCTKIDRYVSVMPGGASRLANLNLLVERATQFKNSKIVNLTLFVQFYEQLSKSSGDMGVASSIAEADDVVRLMSIHKSKGLEFPVVMVAGLGRKFNLMDTHGDLILHKEMGLGLSYVDVEKRVKSNSLVQWVIKETMKTETLSEEMRVLYVALTRPVDRIYLFGTVSDASKRMGKWKRGSSYYNLFTGMNFMDWIMCSDAFAARIIEPTDLMNQEIRQISQSQRRVETWLSWQEIEADEIRELKESAVFKRFNQITWEHELEYKPQKISVTELKRQSQIFHPPALIEMPAFMAGEVTMTAADRGTVMHKVLEHLDFHMSYDDDTLKIFIDQLMEKRFLTEQEVRGIDRRKIIQFLESDLGIKLKTTRHHKETPFVLNHDGQLIQGVIDLYLETEEGLVLVDYKTDFIGRDELQKVADRYKIQLDAYEEALSKISGKAVIEKMIVFLNHNLFYRY